jgi:hypothetical protein
MDSQFYVTTEGLAAGLANPSVHQTLRGILVGRAHPSTIKAFERRHLIAPDKRTDIRADHNTMVLNGTLDRLRTILFTTVQEGDAPDPAEANDGGQPEVAVAPPKAPPAPAPKPAPPKTRYTLAQRTEPVLSPIMEIIVGAIKTHGTASVEELRAASPEVAAINAGTLRWAIQQLRQRGVLASVKA